MADSHPSIDERFFQGATFAELLARPKDNAGLWEAIYRRAAVFDDAAARARRLRANWHLLVVNEDWCGDSVNILPYIARLEEASPRIEMRIIGRDSNRDIMDAHLTGTARSIPIVVVYDDAFAEKGWWGPRPGPLQEWVVTSGLALPKPERYRHIRTWYARDRGATVVSEILSIIEGQMAEKRGPVDELVEYMDATRLALNTTARAIDPAFAGMRARDGSWSASEVVAHLALVEQGVARLVERAIEKARAEGIGAAISSESVMASLDSHRVADAVTRLDAPEKMIPPGDASLDESLDALERSRLTLRNSITGAADIDLSAIFRTHQRLGELNVLQWALFVAQHEERHRRQIERTLDEVAELAAESAPIV